MAGTEPRPEHVLRPGEAADRASLLDLIALQHDPADVPEAALLLDDPEFGPPGWLVAADATGVIACLAPLPTMVRIGAVEFPGLEIEFVTSHPRVGGRGVVRRLFGLMNEIHTDRLVRVMVGIPYFYRRLGYEYAIPVPPERSVDASSVPPTPPGWTIRVLGPADANEMFERQETMQAGADVTVGHTEAKWRWLLASPNYETVEVASPDDRAVGRFHAWDQDVYVFDVAATSTGAVWALLGAAAQRTERTISLLIRPRIAELVSDIGQGAHQDYAYYAQVSDPIRFLDRMRPMFEERLSASPLRGFTGRVLLSFYGSSVTFNCAGGMVGAVEPGPAVRAPVAAGGAGVPPDHFAELVLGPLGFAALSRRYPDVLASSDAFNVMDTLFPPQCVDVQTWVYP